MQGNKLDDLRACISFQRDIRNCNVLWFTETWLNPGIPDSVIQSAGGHRVPGHGHQPAVRGRLGDDAVLIRLPLHAGAGEAGVPAVLHHHAAHRDFAEGFAYWLELNEHWHHLTWEATPRVIHKGIVTAIMNSNWQVIRGSFSPCCDWEGDTGYTRPALRGSRILNEDTA